MPPRPPINPYTDLLPIDDPGWGWESFERFCLGLVRAQDEVGNAHKHGKKGEEQRGIDIEATLEDGRTRTYQCRKRQRFTKRDAEKTVAETTVAADEHVILVTCEVGTAVRDYIATLPNWEIWDKEDIARRVREIEPRELARRLIEDTFGTEWRRAFLGPRTGRVFRMPDEIFEPYLRKGRLFRHSWRLVGRDAILKDLRAVVDDPATRAAVLVGRGGIGKTRILWELSQSSDKQVLFVADGANISLEAADELPLTDCVVVVDDAHRRGSRELIPLMSVVEQRDHPVTLILATRPQRLDELRRELVEVGFGSGEIWISEPLAALEHGASEELAAQALSPAYRHLAKDLALATADCPLVTVVGGQLISQKAIAPSLMGLHDEFRIEVLDRFSEERIGELKPEVDAANAREALNLLSALQPISVENKEQLERIAEDVGVDVPGLKALLGQLEDCGLLVAHGRLRRISPDVLADHILHRYCIDEKGRPTGRAEVLLGRYGMDSFLLRNLSELDWRMGERGEPVDLLGSVWDELAESFRSADAGERLRILDLVERVAYYQPDRSLSLVETAISDPATAVVYSPELSTTDEHVRARLPVVLKAIGRSPRHTRRVFELLWALGRDDERELNPTPEHPIRVIQELGSYDLALDYAASLCEFVESLPRRDDDGHHWSRVDLLVPLLAREGLTSHPRGLQVELRSYFVDPETTGELRERARKILRDECLHGGDRTRYRAAGLLSDALTQPRGLGGQGVPGKLLDAWLPDQLRTLHAIEEVFSQTEDPLVRLKLRDGLEWHARHSYWPEVAERAAAILASPLHGPEAAVAALRPWSPFFDEDEEHQQTVESAVDWIAHEIEPHEAADFFDRWFKRLLLVGEHPGPDRLLRTVTSRVPAHAESLARRGLDEPGSPLAGALPAILDSLGPDAVELRDQLLAQMRAVPRLRPALADYVSRRVPDLSESDRETLRSLVTDANPITVQTALVGVLRMADRDPHLARNLALQAKVGNDSESADRLCSVLTRKGMPLSRDDRVVILEKLATVPRLDYFSREFLVDTAKDAPELVVDLMLDRIASATTAEFEAVPYESFDGGLLAGSDFDTAIRLLRRVREALLGATGLQRYMLRRLFWALRKSVDEPLLVINEWISGDEVTKSPEKAKVAATLLSELPSHSLLARPFFVSDALERAQGLSEASFQEVRRALSAAAFSGYGSRKMGEPAPSDVRTAEQASKNAGLFPVGSPAQEFFLWMEQVAQRNIEESRLQDEEAQDGW